jgi:hypothetical protein
MQLSPSLEEPALSICNIHFWAHWTHRNRHEIVGKREQKNNPLIYRSYLAQCLYRRYFLSSSSSPPPCSALRCLILADIAKFWLMRSLARSFVFDSKICPVHCASKRARHSRAKSKKVGGFGRQICSRNPTPLRCGAPAGGPV